MDDETCSIPVWDSGQRERCGREMPDGECRRHGRKGTGFARSLAEDYFRRTGQPRDGSLDAFHQYEMTLIREWLDRLEAVLDDEGVPRDTAYRVVRCMLYGAPGQAAAEVRMRYDAEMREVLMNRPVRMEYPPDPDTAARLLGKPAASFPAAEELVRWRSPGHPSCCPWRQRARTPRRRSRRLADHQAGVRLPRGRLSPPSMRCVCCRPRMHGCRRGTGAGPPPSPRCSGRRHRRRLSPSGGRMRIQPARCHGCRPSPPGPR
jgi:hypothetical protein